MPSEAQKKSIAKYHKDNFTTLSVRIRNENMVILKDICTSTGILPGKAARLLLEAISNSDPEALALLRRLAADDMPG